MSKLTPSQRTLDTLFNRIDKPISVVDLTTYPLVKGRPIVRAYYNQERNGGWTVRLKEANGSLDDPDNLEIVPWDSDTAKFIGDPDE